MLRKDQEEEIAKLPERWKDLVREVLAKKGILSKSGVEGHRSFDFFLVS
jgi:hypothetical protein